MLKFQYCRHGYCHRQNFKRAKIQNRQQKRLSICKNYSHQLYQIEKCQHGKNNRHHITEQYMEYTGHKHSRHVAQAEKHH